MTGAVIKAAGGNAIVRTAGGGIIGAAVGSPPTLASVSPSSGVDTGGTLLTLIGTNLTGAMAVTLGGAAVGSFTVVNSTTITFTSPSHADGAVSITVTTLSGTSGSVSFTYGPPGSGAVFTTFQVRNASTASQPSTYHQFGHTFAPGEIPAGSYPEVRPTGTGSPVSAYQWDEINTRNDGSWRFAVGTIKTDATLAAYQSTGDTKGYDFAAKTGTPPYVTSTITPTTIAAASQIQLRLSGGDFAAELTGADYYYGDLNYILANYPRDTWGLNPTGGWELVQSGSVCNKYWAWMCARRHSDNAIHKWLVVAMEVKVYTTGEYTINPLVLQPWIYGKHSAGTLGPDSQPNSLVPAQPRYAGFYELWDVTSNTLIGARGGPNDSARNFTIPAANFDPTINFMTQTTAITNYGNLLGGAMADSTGWMFKAASGGTLPSGIDPNWIYWANGTSAPPRKTTFRMERPPSPSPAFASAWAASTSVAQNSYRTSNNVVYYYIGEPATTGSTAPTPNAVGLGVNVLRTDGAATFMQASWNIGSGGSGNIIAMPVCATYGNTAIDMKDENGEPYWFDPINHTAKPWTLPMPDFSYTTKSSHCVQPFDYTTPNPVPDTNPNPAVFGVEKYSPNDVLYDFGGGSWNVMQAVGDDLIDNRIGSWNQRAALRLYQPGDRNSVINAKAMAARFLGHWQFGWDNRTGRVPLINLGHNRAGSDYAGYPTGTINSNLYWYTQASGCQGSPTPMGIGAQISPSSGALINLRHMPGYQTVYGQVINGSHCPNPSLSDRVLDGSYIALQALHALHFGSLAYQPGSYRNSPTGFAGLGGLVNHDYGQIRAHGWDTVKHVNVTIFTPDWHLMMPYHKDNADDQGTYFNNLKTYVDSVSTNYTFWGTMGPLASNPASNMVGYWMFGHEMEGVTFGALAFGSDRPGYKKAMDDFLPGIMKIWYPPLGGCMYYIGLGQITYADSGDPATIPLTLAGVAQLPNNSGLTGHPNNFGQVYGSSFVCPGIGQASPGNVDIGNGPTAPNINICDGYQIWGDVNFSSGSAKKDATGIPLQNLAPVAVAAHVTGADPMYAAAFDAARLRFTQGTMTGLTLVDANTPGSFQLFYTAH